MSGEPNGAGKRHTLPGNILRPPDVQKLRQQLIDGEGVGQAQVLALISSHEHLRAFALAERNKSAVVHRENVDLREILERRGGLP